MTIWILALLLLASLAGLGYRQGAIRVAFSLLGIFFGVLLAVPLAKPMAILLKAFGVVNPVILWLLPPLLVFCVISAIFKSIAFAVHHKVEVHFRYKAGDLRFTLWERLNRRIGLCLGLVNGTAYLILISFVIYTLSYWTVQMEAGDGMSRTARLLNRAGHDLEETGFIKTASAVGRLPESFYDAADVAGLLYQNSLLEARLARYPAFLMLGERQEFQTLANDQQFTEMRARKDPLSQLLAYPPVKTIVSSPDTLNTIWSIAKPDLKDLTNFLYTAHSPKYDQEPILGRWIFDLRGTLAAVRQAQPNLTAKQMQSQRLLYQTFYSKVKLIVGTDSQMAIKDFPNLEAPLAPGTPPPLTGGQGNWSGANGFYQLKYNLDGKDISATAAIEGQRMTVTIEKLALVLTKEY